MTIGLGQRWKTQHQRLLNRIGHQAVAWLCRWVPEHSVRAAFAEQGFHLLKKHCYSPVPDECEVTSLAGQQVTELPGISLDPDVAFDLLRHTVEPHLEEFRETFTLHGGEVPNQFYLINGSFMAVDAHAYYALIRQGKPKRVIEVGVGQSTLLAAAALRRNAQEGVAGHLLAIDPALATPLLAASPGIHEAVAERLQDVPLEVFTSLEAGDILFIDSTHVLRPGGDVQRAYCEILPRLAPGVLVHIHDICLPKPYPTVYFDNQWYWNEQYLLHAFLAFNQRFDVVWPGAYLTHYFPEKMREVFPEIAVMQERYPLSDASSFWMKVRA